MLALRYPDHRFRAFADLTAQESDALAALGDPPVQRLKGEMIHCEGARLSGFHLHIKGWIASSVMLPSGKRLIQKIHLPGDMLSTPSMVLSRAADTLTLVTDAVTAFVPYERFGRLLTEAPRLGALFTVAIQMERLALMDALAIKGHASAREQLARLLIDLHTRLTPIGAVRDDAFDLPLTQELMGDLLGLSSVHVNRTLMALDNEGLIARHGQRFSLLDLPRLTRLCPLPPRQPSADIAWLPARTD